MTEKEIKIKIEQASLYRDIKSECEKKLQSYIFEHENSGFTRKIYNFSHGTPLGYAFFKKPKGLNFETLERETEEYFWIDINNQKSEKFIEFSDLLLSAKTRGSIKPFSWTYEQIKIIQNCDPYINAKSETIPIKGLHGNKVGFVKINKK